MSGTNMVRLVLTISININLVLFISALDNNATTKSKRQIFREQVNPQAGGRIPEDAFRSDRLALNRLNKEGIAVPDGVVLEARHRESHYGSHRHDPDIQASIVKVVLGEDGRYAPPEGRYPFNNLVESTYVLRPSINTPVIAVPPRRPHLATLRLPARPYFQHDPSAINSLDQQIDFFNAFDPNFASPGLWTGLLGAVPDVPNRLLRRQAKIPYDDFVAQNSNVANKVSNHHNYHSDRDSSAEQSDYSREEKTSHYKSRTTHGGRNLHHIQVLHHDDRYSSEEKSRPSYNRYSDSHSKAPHKSSDDYEKGLVPVYLTPHKTHSHSSHKGSNFLTYVTPTSKLHYQQVLPIINLPVAPNYYIDPYEAVITSTVKPLEKTVKSKPHYVLDPPKKHIYNGGHDKVLVPVQQVSSPHHHSHHSHADHHNSSPQYNLHHHHSSDEHEHFHNTVRTPHVNNALFNEKENDNKHEEKEKTHNSDYTALEESFPNPPSQKHHTHLDESHHHQNEHEDHTPIRNQPHTSHDQTYSTHQLHYQEQHEQHLNHQPEPERYPQEEQHHNTHHEQIQHDKHPHDHYQGFNNGRDLIRPEHDELPQNQQPTHPHLQEQYVPVNTESNDQSHLQFEQPPPVEQGSGVPDNQNINYQLVNSFKSSNEGFNNQGVNNNQAQNHFVPFQPTLQVNNEPHNQHFQYTQVNFGQNENQQQERPQPHTLYEEHYQQEVPPTQQIIFDRPNQNWQNQPVNNLQIVKDVNQEHHTGDNGVQYVRGGLHFEVVNNQGIRHESRGELGQKTQSYPQQQELTIQRTTTDEGKNHLNQVLHYIEPNEVVQQISTAPSIEHEYPSLDTVPETSFQCKGAPRSMLPDPETSCQVFHLCNGNGSKESFLCPKGSRYDAQKQQCAPWTEVACQA